MVFQQLQLAFDELGLILNGKKVMVFQVQRVWAVFPSTVPFKGFSIETHKNTLYSSLTMVI